MGALPGDDEVRAKMKEVVAEAIEEEFICRGEKKYGCTKISNDSTLYVCLECAEKEKQSIAAQMEDVAPEHPPVIEDDQVRFV